MLGVGILLAIVIWFIVFRQTRDEISGTLGSAGEYEGFVIAFEVLVSGFLTAIIMSIIFIIVTVIFNIGNWKRPKNQPKKQPNIEPYVQALHDKQRGAKKPMTLQDFWEREKEKEKKKEA